MSTHIHILQFKDEGMPSITRKQFLKLSTEEQQKILSSIPVNYNNGTYSFNGHMKHEDSKEERLIPVELNKLS
jgi:hypothetical protein